MGRGRERSGVGDDSIVTINVNGQPVTIDNRTLNMRERQLMKLELSKLGYPPDDMDAMMAAIWVVMRRSDPALTFIEVCESITLADIADSADADIDEADPEG